jgi:inorganic pyrophosphatase
MTPWGTLLVWRHGHSAGAPLAKTDPLPQKRPLGLFENSGRWNVRAHVLVGAVIVAAVGSYVQASGARCRDLERENLVAPGFRVVNNCLVPKAHHHFNFYRGVRPLNPNGTVNAVIEIPAGTNAKWEVSEETGVMCWEIKNGALRVVKYLGYPANYGMIPRTLGGDGDSLDIITLGELRFRGEIAAAKVIGVMRMIDGGEVDDKIIAVLPGTPLGDVNSISELDAAFPGSSSILATWFGNYKGPGGEIEINGFGGPEEAWEVLDAGLAGYQQ